MDQSDKLTGEHVTLWVYARGEAARDLPHQLWAMIEEAGDWQRIMWVDQTEPSRVSKFGDLAHFVAYMFDDRDPKIWLLVSDNETGDIAGVIWFNKITKKSAYGSIWMSPKYRGKPHVREAGKLGLAFGHELMGWDLISTATPWPDVRNFDKRLGFKEVAFVPKVFGVDVWLLEHHKNG